jgi:hypothetical protein
MCLGRGEVVVVGHDDLGLVVLVEAGVPALRLKIILIHVLKF